MTYYFQWAVVANFKRSEISNTEDYEIQQKPTSGSSIR